MKSPLQLICGLIISLTIGGSTTATAQTSSSPTPKVERQTATLAAGCFWCMEAIFNQLKGVEKVTSGYAGGQTKDPTYQQVETGLTGHAETVNVIFDPSVITFRELLEVYFTMRDPTTLNRQGNDIGTQYRSAIFYHNEAQRRVAYEMIKKVTDNHLYPNKVVTEVTLFTNFYPAEDYHNDYYKLHKNQPYCQFVIGPELDRFRATFRSKLKQ